jgi:threonine dehydratase
LASGVGYAVRSLAEHVEVIGIQPLGAPAMALSWRHGTVVETDRIDTIADGVAGRCPIPEVLDDLLVVLDASCSCARTRSWLACVRSMSMRGSSSSRPQALGLGAVLEQPERFAGRHVTTILCGSNVAPADFAGGCWNELRESHASRARHTRSRATRSPMQSPRRTAQNGAWDKPGRHPGSPLSSRGPSSPLD